ncbi:hypothetical protein ACJ6WD_10575 [Streptomyces sp. VTCC 41912]|uniref:hypothetical protein n=1 Tax=Streptomyces sp. VTCC 41912 TaxID=3383243 RepID=UPI003896E8FB
MEERSDRKTLELAREMVKAMKSHVQGGVSQYPSLRALVPYLMAGIKQVPNELIPLLPADQREMSAMARDAAVHELWRGGRSVLAMDECLLSALSESSAELPKAVVRGLRYRNPLIVLTTPDFSDEDTDYYREHVGIPLVAYTFGRWDNAQLMCSMHDDRFEDLGVMFVGYISTPKGLVLQMLRCTVPLDRQSTTVAEAVARTVSGFHFNDDLGERDITRLATWLRKYLTQVLHTVSYAGSNPQDAELYRPPVKRAGKGKKTRRPRQEDVTEFVKLGSLLSRELRELRTVKPSEVLKEIDDCTCVEFCDEDPNSACSLSGIPHVHPAAQGLGFGPCPEHPDRPGDH